MDDQDDFDDIPPTGGFSAARRRALGSFWQTVGIPAAIQLLVAGGIVWLVKARPDIAPTSAAVVADACALAWIGMFVWIARKYLAARRDLWERDGQIAELKSELRRQRKV